MSSYPSKTGMQLGFSAVYTFLANFTSAPKLARVISGARMHKTAVFTHEGVKRV